MVGFKCIGCNFNTELFEMLLIYFERHEVATLADDRDFTEYEIGLSIEIVDGGYVVSVCEKGQVVASQKVDESKEVSPAVKEMFVAPIKNSIKRTCATLLEQYTKYKAPWGIQTGVKPVKLATMCKRRGMADVEGADFLAKELLIRQDKCEVLFKVAENEHKILETTPQNSYSIYVGTPFCPTICSYCSFGSYPIGAYKACVEQYVDSVVAEARAAAKVLDSKGLTCDCVYFGGGTPTSIEASQMDRMMSGVLEVFSPKELTCEAGRPDSINEEKLAVMRKNGVDRLAINPQTMKAETLRRIGRRHTPEDTVRIYELARSMGFGDINMDLIAGLEGETVEDFENTLSWIKKLDPEGFTVHSLCLKRASKLMKDQGARADAKQMDAMVDAGYALAREMGMEPYYLYRQKNASGNLENTGFAKPGRFCRYNVLIEEETQHILGLGAGAVSKAVKDPVNLERCFNIKDPLQYIADIDGQIAKKIDFLQKMY